MKKLLFVFDKQPYVTEAMQELLDAAYAQAAFGHSVSLLFCHKGLECLANTDSTKPSISKQLKAWELYEIERLIALGDSSDIPSVVADIDWIASLELTNLVNQFDQVITL